MSKIFVIDDDSAAEILVEHLQIQGYDVNRVASATSALDSIDEIAAADLVILDIIMERPNRLDASPLSGDRSTGAALLRLLKKKNPHVKVLVYSATADTSIIESIRTLPNVEYQSKWGAPHLKDLVAIVRRMIGVSGERSVVRAFIVHGRDEREKLALKNYIQNTLKMQEPTILHERPNFGRTIMEKFEEESTGHDVVFVLMTPDDRVAAADDSASEKRRARQNVIFEMGYFVGVYGRRSGRVILLHKGSLELPSDLLGVAYIDISAGIDAAGEEIRRELQNVL